MKLTEEKFLDRAKGGFGALDSNRSIFEDCYEYLNPFRNTYGQVTTGQTMNKPTKQYDSTAAIAAADFVNTMQSNFTPVFVRWAELRAGPGIPDKDRSKYNKQLSKLTDVIFAYIDSSNFATAVSEFFWDLGVGTGALWLFEGDDNQPLNFVASPMSQMGLVEGRFGTVDGRFRKHKVKARLIEDTWPSEKVTLNEDLRKLQTEKPEEELELIEGCYYDYDEFVWRYEVIHEGTKHRLVESFYTEEICFTPRWSKIPGFAYGIGPFILAQADYKTLNKMKEYMLMMAAINVFGIYTVANSGVINPNTLDLSPGTFIPVERNGGTAGPSIAALPRAGDFQVQEFMIQDLQEQIRKTMLSTKLPPDQGEPKTAYEIAQRLREFQMDIGSAYGRILYEFVLPLFRRIIGIMNRKGLIKLPDGFAIDNFFVQVQVVSPVAKAQGIEDVQRFFQSFGLLTSSVGQQLAMTAYEVEKFPQWIADKTGSGTDLLRDDADAKAMRDQIAQLIAQQAQEAQRQAS